MHIISAPISLAKISDLVREAEKCHPFPRVGQQVFGNTDIVILGRTFFPTIRQEQTHRNDLGLANQILSLHSLNAELTMQRSRVNAEVILGQQGSSTSCSNQRPVLATSPGPHRINSVIGFQFSCLPIIIIIIIIYHLHSCLLPRLSDPVFFFFLIFL